MLNLIFGGFEDECSQYYHLFQEKINTGLSFTLDKEEPKLENLIYLLWRKYVKVLNSRLLKDIDDARLTNHRSMVWLRSFHYGILFPGDVIELSWKDQKIVFPIIDQGSHAWCEESLYNTPISGVEFSIKLLTPSLERDKINWTQGMFIKDILERKIEHKIGGSITSEFRKSMEPKSVVGWMEIEDSYPEDFIKLNRGKPIRLSKETEDFIMEIRKRLWTLKDQSHLIALHKTR